MSNRTSDLAESTISVPVAEKSLTRRPTVTIPVPELENLVQEFLLDCQLRQLTKRTIEGYRNQFKHLFWFIKQHNVTSCGTPTLKQFMHYLQEPPPVGGRWGKPHLTEPMRPQTAKDYHITLCRFFNWMIDEEILTLNPMQRVPAPIVRNGLKQPLRPEQVDAMMKAARNSQFSKRNTAILLFLLDTGLRASELCSLKMCDMDFNCRQARVIGKGNKTRMCYWGLVTAKAITRYLRHEDRSANDAVFTTVGGTKKGGTLTPQGLYKIVRDIGEAAGVKCTCHDWRRTFAVNILKNGANLISVQRLMGHETLTITQGYLNVAQTDIEEQHRQYSPADRLSFRS